MFDGTVYTDQEVDPRAGDRAYVLTDGAFTNERRMADIIELLGTEEHGVHRSPPESIRRLVDTLTRGGKEPENDITMVCVDWLR